MHVCLEHLQVASEETGGEREFEHARVFLELQLPTHRPTDILREREIYWVW